MNKRAVMNTKWTCILCAAAMLLAGGVLQDGEAAQHGEVSLVPVTEKVSAVIGMSPGLYELPEPLELEVDSAAPGWELWVHAKHLRLQSGRGQGKKIHAREVCLSDGDGELLSLQRPRTAAAGGYGRTKVAVSLATETGSRMPAGTYTGHLTLKAHVRNGPPSRALIVPVELEVEGRMNHTIHEDELQFIVGRFDEPVEESVGGLLEADMPVSLILSVSDGRIDSVPLLEADGSGGGAGAPEVPIEWALREEPSAPLRAPDAESTDGRSLFWELPGTPGSLEYSHCGAVRTNAEHVPGRYGMKVKITVAPDP